MWRLRSFSYLDTPTELQKLDGKKPKLDLVSLSQSKGQHCFFMLQLHSNVLICEKNIVKFLHSIFLQRILGPDVVDRSQ